MGVEHLDDQLWWANPNCHGYGDSCTHPNTIANPYGHCYRDGYTHRDGHRYRYANTNCDSYGHPNNNTDTDTNACRGKPIRHCRLLLESESWPSAKCDAHPDWQYVRLDPVRRLR